MFTKNFIKKKNSQLMFLFLLLIVYMNRLLLVGKTLV